MAIELIKEKYLSLCHMWLVRDHGCYLARTPSETYWQVVENNSWKQKRTSEKNKQVNEQAQNTVKKTTDEKRMLMLCT